MSFKPSYQFPGIPKSWQKVHSVSFLEAIETNWILEGLIKALCFTEEKRDNVPELIPSKHFLKADWKNMVTRFVEEIESLPEPLRHCPQKNFIAFGIHMLYSRNGVGPSFSDDGIWTDEEANALDEWAESLGTIDVLGVTPPHRKVSINWPSKSQRKDWSERMGHNARLTELLLKVSR